MIKQITCAVIVTDGHNVLICKPTGNNPYWSFPKGINEENESYLETALRELKEETNIIIDPFYMINANSNAVEYLKNKDIIFFTNKYLTKNLPKLENCKCNSMFFDKKTKKHLPEISEYRYVNFIDLHIYVNNNLLLALERVNIKYD